MKKIAFFVLWFFVSLIGLLFLVSSAVGIVAALDGSSVGGVPQTFSSGYQIGEEAGRYVGSRFAVWFIVAALLITALGTGFKLFPGFRERTKKSDA